MGKNAVLSGREIAFDFRDFVKFYKNEETFNFPTIDGSSVMAKPVVFSKTQTGTYLIKGQILSDTAGDKNELNDFTLVFMEAAF